MFVSIFVPVFSAPQKFIHETCEFSRNQFYFFLENLDTFVTSFNVFRRFFLFQRLRWRLTLTRFIEFTFGLLVPTSFDDLHNTAMLLARLPATKSDNKIATQNLCMMKLFLFSYQSALANVSPQTIDDFWLCVLFKKQASYVLLSRPQPVCKHEHFRTIKILGRYAYWRE